MRLFAAILIPDDVREHLAAMQERLRAAEADVKWTKPDDLHLTVQFIGDVSDSLLPDIESACETLASETEPFRVAVRGGSYFPRHGKTIKVIWAGLFEGTSEWQTLARAAEAWFIPMGAAKSEGLVPHLTLGRVKSETNLDALRAAIRQEADTDAGAWTASELVLIQSTLAPTGAIYQNINKWKLGNRQQATGNRAE